MEWLRRGVFGGATLGPLGRPLLALGIFAGVVSPLGLLSFVWAVRRARRDGSLSHY